MASILSAVASAAWASRLAGAVRFSGRLLPAALFGWSFFPEEVEVRFGRADVLSSGAASRRSFLLKSENIPTVSLRGTGVSRDAF
jgi:hypothetical protein